MTFGKRLLLHFYTYKFFANCHTHLSPQMQINQTDKKTSNRGQLTNDKKCHIAPSPQQICDV